MLNYLQSQLFSSDTSIPSIQNIDKILHDLQNDNTSLEQQIKIYEQKIQKLPLQIRRKIIQQQQFNSQSNQQSSQNQNQKLQKSQQFYVHNPNIYTSKHNKSILEQKLKNLQQEQQQISYISKLSDIYIRCKKQSQNIINLQSEQNEITDLQNIRDKLHHQKSSLQRQQLQQISQFIKSIKPYSQNINQKQISNYQLVNQLIYNIKLHTGKKLIQKCQNLIHYGPSGNNDKIIIQKYLIKNCKSIILGNQNKLNQQLNDKNIKIINKFIQKIINQVIYYDVSYQKIILMQIINSQSLQNQKHQQIIQRKKVYFFPIDTQKYFKSILTTLKYHINKIDQLKTLLLDSTHQDSIQLQFDKVVQTHISQIKSNLEYILPYLNIKSRKQLMAILTHGKGQIIEFQDLVLRLKFKGQDGDMFINNLDAVFSRLVQIKDGREEKQEQIKFNDKNYNILTSFFELGIFEAQQSLLQSSSKAIMKLTTNFSRRGSFQKSQAGINSTKHNSKKLFNMIFFSVSNLIERFDQLIYKNADMFCLYSELLKQSYDEKLDEWITKLIEIRENVRKRIHQE